MASKLQTAKIMAVQCGQPKGYIKAVYYNTGKFALTSNVSRAKNYYSSDEVQREIDFLSKYNANYVYTYDWFN